MNRLRLRPPFLAQTASPLVFALMGAAVFGIAAVRGDDAPGRETPAPFQPFEYLLGSWKGRGGKADDPSQRFRGWDETHSWAWSFKGGKPTAMTVEFKGSKLFKSGVFSFDEKQKRYQLKVQALEPADATIVYEGGLDAKGKLLTLVRSDVKTGEPAEQLTLRPNGSFILYKFVVERKPADRVRFSPAIEVGLKKEGETFAAGGSAVAVRKCIITGGAATQSVSYQGRAFPICCTGCRDEFLDNPEKYLKKISLAKEKDADAREMPAQPARPRVRGNDDAFAGDVVGDDAPSKPRTKPKPKTNAKPKPSDEAEAEADADAPASDPAKQAADRADGLLRVARNLEKIGKTDAALKDYREIVKKFPDAPAAKTARERIKALGDH